MRKKARGNAGVEAFIADEMLAKLARFMRMAGVRVLHIRGMDDERILRLAKSKGMPLLTCDEQLWKRCEKRGIKSLLLSDQPVFHQLLRVFRSFQLPPPRFSCSTLCPQCGGRLIKAHKSTLSARVYPRVLKKRRLFWECAGCGKLYWSGTHYERVRRLFWRVRKKMEAKISPQG
ncbi:MAG: Mut7-C RNAse domain-containing protein [Candidatus Micrarchaeota archaeon]|nr:Mut7-C RNAse domain-containing protein [Candidatus Micrarchaeota archaeon]